MKIAIIGYGKMGKAIENIALSHLHQIVLKSNAVDAIYLSEQLQNSQADAAIEFSNPASALQNVQTCFRANIPVVSGTTGWLTGLEQAKADCLRQKGAFFYAPNFSIGVNLFFLLNEKFAHIMSAYPSYETKITETHHTQKLDSPSGTAITLGQSMVDILPNKQKWVSQAVENSNEIPIISHRIDQVLGTHSVEYFSPIDTIEIKHTAHSRDGFAQGAVVAAEWIIGKQGYFEMKDMLKI